MEFVYFIVIAGLLIIGLGSIEGLLKEILNTLEKINDRKRVD